MKFYHGSMIKGLTQLQPHLPVGAHSQKPLVYLTTSRQLALHYIWDTERLGVKMPMLDIRKDGTFVFQEMFSGALEYFYKGVSGYIYHCEGDYPITTDSGVPTCAVSDTAVSITECEYIEDMHRPMKFINIIASGNIKIEDIQAYLKAGAKAVGLGRALYKDATYEEITKRAKLALEKVKNI